MLGVTRLLLAHKSDLMLDDWPDEAVIAASAAIVRTLGKCAAAAQRNGDLEWLRRFAWFTGRTAVPLH